MTATADLWERRSLFDDDHEEFRASVREFLTPLFFDDARISGDLLLGEVGEGGNRSRSRA